MPDPADCLRDAAQARHDATLRRAEATLRMLARHGAPITFRGFAELAGVSRSWLYPQPELREQLEQLRQQRSSRAPAVPSAERANHRLAASADPRLPRRDRAPEQGEPGALRATRPQTRRSPSGSGHGPLLSPSRTCPRRQIP